MPVVVRKVDGKYRLVEQETGRVVVYRNGAPVDGGGHMTAAAAKRQCVAMNRKVKQKGFG